MQIEIADILVLLGIIKSYSINKPASHQYVIKTFNDTPVRKARVTDYRILEQLCTELGLISIKNNAILITDLGKTIINYSKNKSDFNDKFVYKVILGPNSMEKIKLSILKFNLDNNGTYSYPKRTIYDLFTIPSIIPILYESGFLEKIGSRIRINPKYSKLIFKKISQGDLEKQLQHRKKIGEIGEKIAYEFEKARLTDLGHHQDMARIKLISKEFANAGYDMESFDIDEDGKIYKIYVEIKASTEDKIEFYWSANELEKAKNYSNDYWIYFIANIDETTQTSTSEVIRLQNPYKTVFNNPSFRTEPSQYRIFDKSSDGEPKF